MDDTISRQAAIDAVKAYWKKVVDDIPKGVGFEELTQLCNMALEHNANILKAIDQLPSAQPEQRWIPVSERLPEPRVDVWVNSDIGQIQGYYEEHVGVWYASFGQGRDYLELIVNAWMPLPEPYKERREE